MEEALFWQRIPAATSIINIILSIANHQRGTRTLRSIRRRLALKVEGLARVSKNAERRPRVATVWFDGRFMG
jgi:hypothetical protein